MYCIVSLLATAKFSIVTYLSAVQQYQYLPCIQIILFSFVGSSNVQLASPSSFSLNRYQLINRFNTSTPSAIFTIITITTFIVQSINSGFGFVSFTEYDSSQKALDNMIGHELAGRPIRIERARRAAAHQKTPGKCKSKKRKMFQSAR